MELTLHAPAKVNLTLIVGARRDDGYHDVSTVMQTVGLRYPDADRRRQRPDDDLHRP